MTHTLTVQPVSFATAPTPTAPPPRLTVTPEPDVEPEQPTPGEWTQPPRRLP